MRRFGYPTQPFFSRAKSLESANALFAVERRIYIILGVKSIQYDAASRPCRRRGSPAGGRAGRGTSSSGIGKMRNDRPLTQASVPFHHISELEMHSVNRQDISRLSEAGFCTVEAVSILRVRLNKKPVLTWSHMGQIRSDCTCNNPEAHRN